MAVKRVMVIYYSVIAKASTLDAIASALTAATVASNDGEASSPSKAA